MHEFSVYIDNWSIPQSDVEIYLGYRAMSFVPSHMVSSLCAKYHFGQPKSIARFQRLVEDSRRKRFVDVVASILSRSYLINRTIRNIRTNQRISSKGVERRTFGDATGNSIRIMKGTMKTFPTATDSSDP